MAKYPEMNWQAKDLVDEFKLFKQRLILCLQDNDIAQPDRQVRIAVGTVGLKTP